MGSRTTESPFRRCWISTYRPVTMFGEPPARASNGLACPPASPTAPRCRIFKVRQPRSLAPPDVGIHRSTLLKLGVEIYSY
jgi:hypothetical protein